VVRAMDEGIGGEGAKFAEVYRPVKLVSGMWGK